MTAAQYQRIEELLQRAEDVTNEHPLLTQQGAQIRTDIRALLANTTLERIRSENREDLTAPPLKVPKDR